MKPKLYLETTIPSYLAARPSRDLIVAGHQQITREWWVRRRNAFNMYISQFVVDEAKAGDSDAVRERTKIVEDLPLLDITSEVEIIAGALLGSGVISRKDATDAAHIAVATVHGMDFLLTWNCAHIANAGIARAVEDICRRNGYDCPVICTPEELLVE